MSDGVDVSVHWRGRRGQLRAPGPGKLHKLASATLLELLLFIIIRVRL